ncbi:MAG: spore cortex biosynthesis protein YabQ [Firmicutes bacterium]|nr:spore cortex biosynthesis protein YabQ [Bacillota bacterium]
MESLSVQLYAFAITIIAGATTGLLFDLYRLSRGYLRPGLVATAVMDLFFWLVVAPVLTVYLLLANWGQLRFYVLVGILLGLALYYLVFSRLVIHFCLCFFDIIGKVLSLVYQIVFVVVTWPIRLAQDIGVGLNVRRLGRARIVPNLRWRSPMFMFLKRR